MWLLGFVLLDGCYLHLVLVDFGYGWCMLFCGLLARFLTGVCC